MPEQLVDAEADEKKDLKQLESSLQALWEKARLVSESLLRFKAENRELQNRITSLEVKERHWTEELQRRDRDLEEVRKQLAQAQSNGRSLFSKEESEVLKTRLREFIIKISSRL